MMFLGVLVAVGGFPASKKAEKFEDRSWTEIQEAPFGLFDYAAIFYTGNFYYFGSEDTLNSGYAALNSILCLNAITWTWSNVGQLNSARSGHGVILIDNTFMVIGGSGHPRNEVCHLNNGRFTCERKTSSLSHYYRTPLLFLVSDDFGLWCE